MKIKRFLFVSSVVLLAAVCLGVMNMKYDRLSRYPYEDEEARELIDHFFTNEEISYLIEYSIAPSEFIDYIDAPGFSIYHASQYNQVKESIWYLNDDNIVFLVELSFGKMSVEELIHTLLNYDADTVVRFLQKGDEYLSGSSLIEYPTSLTVIVDDTHTLSSRILFDAIAISSLPSASGEPLMVSEVVVDPIKAMCIAIEKDLDNKQTCGGLVAQSGYVPYEQQQILYRQGTANGLHVDVPGHSEHQLGTAFDFIVKDIDADQFPDSKQYQWLKSNAHRFGFVESYPKGKEEITGKQAQPWHWRFVGVKTAQELYFNQKTLFEVDYE